MSTHILGIKNDNDSMPLYTGFTVLEQNICLFLIS